MVSITTTVWTSFIFGWQTNYWSLWLMKEMGATVAIVGFLSIFQTAEQLFYLPGGILTDKFGRRKIILFGTCLRLMSPIIYLLAKNWEHVLLAAILNATSGMYMPAFEAIVADSLPSKQRGAGYGAYRMITSLPSIFMPTIGGIVMDALGYKEGVRLFNVLTVFALIGVIIARYKYLTETLERKSGQKSEPRSTRATLSSALKVPRPIYAMIIVATISSFALRMTMQLIPIYAKDIIQLTNTEIGIAQTAFGLMTTILIMPTGMLSDRIGRKTLIILAQIIGSFTTWATVLATSFPQYIIIKLISSVGGSQGMFGGVDRSPAWQALVADLVPSEKRGTVMGLISTVSSVCGLPATIAGSYIWAGYSPASAFHVSLIVGLIAIPIFALSVKEPKKKEE